MKLDELVKYSRPQLGEEDIRFILREINGDRVLLELVCDMPIRPLETVPFEEICTANDVLYHFEIEIDRSPPRVGQLWEASAMQSLLSAMLASENRPLQFTDS